MAQQDINIGAANQGNGDTLFEAFTKTQANFDLLFTDDTGDVDSVNGQTGTVVLDSDDISDAGKTNQWDKTVTLTEGDNVTITGTYPNFTIASNDVVGAVSSVSAGTGISVNQTTGAVTVTNSEPNATHTGDVTGATALTIASGAVTNAKMAANSVDSDQYVDGSIDTVHLANDVVTYDKLGAEFTTSAAVGATTLDFSTAQVFTKANSGTVTYTITNADTGMVKDLILTGTGSFSITGGKLVAGSFVESVTNFIQIVAQSSSIFWYSISQEQ